MSTYRGRIYETIRIRFYSSSFISNVTDIFYHCGRLFNYLKKLAQQQGLSFVIGIAIGVNLVLLLQMSEDINNKLSETSAGSIIGITAIILIVASESLLFTCRERQMGGLVLCQVITHIYVMDRQ